jgi:hypothetical protein
MRLKTQIQRSCGLRRKSVIALIEKRLPSNKPNGKSGRKMKFMKLHEVGQNANTFVNP